MKINLSKALKLKNRLAGRLSRVKATVISYNSVLEGNEVDLASSYDEYRQIVDALISLKSSIYEGNKGIHPSIIKMGEVKAEIELLNSLNTRHGTEPGYQGQDHKYVAFIKKADVDKRVKLLEKEIDELQDLIDQHNATERITVPDSVMELLS